MDNYTSNIIEWHTICCSRTLVVTPGVNRPTDHKMLDTIIAYGKASVLNKNVLEGVSDGQSMILKILRGIDL